jgi:hypothetical protein
MKVTPEDIIWIRNTFGWIFTDEKLIKKLLKYRRMKITEETKIAELIPEDMELDEKNAHRIVPEINDMKNKMHVLCIPLKKKELTKTFNWYVREYMIKNNQVIPPESHPKPSEWDIMERVGLLKFICDDIDCLFIQIINKITMTGKNVNIEVFGFDKIKSICPEEFLISFLK